MPVKVKGLTGAVAVSAGQQFSLALLSNGEVMGWGDNGFNQLGQPDGFPGGIGSSNVPVQVPGLAHVTAISAGALFGLALLAGGTVDGWGDGAFGQLGNGTTNTLTTPTAVSGLTGVERHLGRRSEQRRRGGGQPPRPRRRRCPASGRPRRPSTRRPAS